MKTSTLCTGLYSATCHVLPPGNVASRVHSPVLSRSSHTSPHPRTHTSPPSSGKCSSASQHGARSFAKGGLTVVHVPAATLYRYTWFRLNGRWYTHPDAALIAVWL